jgi:hypothetical protein
MYVATPTPPKPPTTTKQNVYPAVHIRVLAGKNPDYF